MNEKYCPECGAQLNWTRWNGGKEVRWWCPVALKERAFDATLGYHFPPGSLHGPVMRMYWRTVEVERTEAYEEVA